MSSLSLPRPRAGLSRAAAATVGGYKLRVTPWQGRRTVALVGPSRLRRGLQTADVSRCLEDLAERGVDRAYTPALNPFEAEPFFQAGFVFHEQLHLLARHLGDGVAVPTHKLRPGRRYDRARVLDIDRRAFDSFWQFDKMSLKEARHATPSNRFMVALDGRNVIGYAVTGKAGRRGYLQRLAVDPDRRGEGIGTSLIHDAFRWLEGRNADLVMVNTQESNTRALSLYERHGFVRQRHGLLVLSWNRVG